MGAGCLGRADRQVRIKVIPKQLNNYIDRLSKFHLNRLKDLFNEVCLKHSKQSELMNIKAFRAFFSGFVDRLSTKTQCHIFDYFDEEAQQQILFGEFVSRLSIILFSQISVFNRILFNFYDHGYTKQLRQEQIALFNTENGRFLSQPLKLEGTTQKQQISISLEQFSDMLNKLSFNYTGYRKQFDVVDVGQDQDALCQHISRCSETKWTRNDRVYVLSCRWFQKWKLFVECTHSTLASSSGKKQTDETRIIAQKPVRIDNSQLEGEYQQQLKQNIIFNHHYMLIAEDLWQKLYKIYKGGPVYQRYVFGDNLVELYPVHAHLVEADKKGNIDRQNIKQKTFRVHASLQILLDAIGTKCTYFYKNIGDSEWNKLQDLSLPTEQQPLLSQCFIAKVQTQFAEQFLKKNQRTELTAKNVELGDKVKAISPIDGQHKVAYVLAFKGNGFLVHYLHYPSSYDRIVKPDELSFETKQNGALPPIVKKKKHFRGIRNMGNTCFINSIVQDLLGISILTDYLANKKQFDRIASKGKKKMNLASCLARIVQKDKDNIDAMMLKSTINNSMPEFSGFEQHDAQQFLSLILNNLSEELKLEEITSTKEMLVRRNIIDELFRGSTQSKIICDDCKAQKTIVQNFYTLSVPLPKPEFDYFKVLIYPNCFETPQKLRKVGFKLKKNSTLVLVNLLQEDYLREFNSVTGRRAEDYFMLQVYSSCPNRILNLKSNIPKLLSDLYIRSDTPVVAYEKLKKLNLTRRIETEFKQSVRTGMWIDYIKEFKDEKQVWSFGVIEEITQDRSCQNDIKNFIAIKDGQQINTIKFGDHNIAPFLSEVVRNHVANIKVTHRMFNQGTSKIEIFALPFIATIPYWATYSELIEVVTKQIHIFILKDQQKNSYDDARQQCKTQGTSRRYFSRRESFEKFDIVTSRHMTSQIRHIGKKQQLIDRKARVMSEVETPPSSKSPSKHSKQDYYRVILTNQRENGCPRCENSIDHYLNPKSKLQKCECEYKDEIPLHWQVDLKKINIFVDWKNLLQFNPNYGEFIKEDSCLLLQKLEESDIKSLEDCLDIFSQQEYVDNQCQSCKHETCKLRTLIHQSPPILIIHLKRFKYEDKYLVKLQNQIKFDFELNLSDYAAGSNISNYELFAVTCHLGSGTQGHYVSYVMRQHPIDNTIVWVMYDDDQVSMVDRSKILKLKAYLLFYRAKNLPSSTYINYMLKPPS